MVRLLIMLSLPLALLVGAGCDTSEDDDDVGDDDGGDDDTGDDDTGDDDTAGGGPCASGWGEISDPAVAIHVRVDGDDAGDGSMAAPLATLQAALELSRQREDDKRIALGPGTYHAALAIMQDAPGQDQTDDGLALEGCSADEVTVSAELPGESIIRISEADGVRIAGLTLQGGTRPLAVSGGATLEMEVVRIENGGSVGLIMGGSDTLVHLINSDILDTQSAVHDDGFEVGYGIQVSLGTLTMEGGSVQGSHRAGILAAQATLDLDGVLVSDTVAASDGTLGRGIQLQDLAGGTIHNCNLIGNEDAALFSLLSPQLTVSDTLVEATAESALPSSPDFTGDGLVASQGGENYDPASFSYVFSGNEITTSARAAIVVDSVTAEVSSNTMTGNGLEQQGTSAFSQGNAVVTGSDVVLDLGQPLSLYLDPIELDSP